jgi:hypothetical protein
MNSNKVGRGSLRAVEPKNERSPSYKGSVEIEGRKYWLSGWRRMGDDGKYWLSLSVEAADEPAEQPARTYANRRDDSEIPF